MSIKIETSYGELLDKITILEIKLERISDKEKLQNIKNEYESLSASWNSIENADSVQAERQQLKQINETLWEIEDNIRDKEREQEFDEEFIALARSVYFTNDKRAEAKKQVNLKLGSSLQEEKSYQDYGPGTDA